MSAWVDWCQTCHHQPNFAKMTMPTSHRLDHPKTYTIKGLCCALSIGLLAVLASPATAFGKTFANSSADDTAQQTAQNTVQDTVHILSTTISQVIKKSTEQDQLYQGDADIAQSKPLTKSTQAPASVLSFDEQFAECNEQFADRHAPTLVGKQGEKLSGLTKALCFDGFATLHSGIARTPLWSASHLTKARIGQARILARVDNFHPETRLRPAERAELADYRRSGFDRGHVAPNGDMATVNAQYASFSLANIAPQNSEHNRNLWRHIEISTRQLAVQHDEIYVVTGVAFLGKTERVGGRVLVPSHFFKAVYIPSLSAAGVYFSPNDGTGNYQIISLSELTYRTGISAMPSLPDDIQQHAHRLPTPMQTEPSEQTPIGSQSSGWLEFAIAIVRYLVEFLHRA
ncbi:DNA/RNA non-specific endonuclease [Moraxella marmotae]|uniref:DNA/RNA non-specific endonuclease n=1 Tax=Moraxella marmotae TaxID=3344520 RepID=UPI0035D498F2